MSEKRVIARKYMPTNLPLLTTAVAYLFLDKFQAAGWVWGAASVVLLLFWAGGIYSLYQEEQYEVVLGQRKP